MTQLPMRPGELVEVLPAAEIFATLDAQGESHSIPFMPEMLRFIGKQYRVGQLAHKLCHPQGAILLPSGSLYLEQLRCDGSAHGGCQAECRFLWREEWLRRVVPGMVPHSGDTEDEQLRKLVKAKTKVDAGQPSEQPAWRCQATQIPCAGKCVSWKEPGQYFREVSSGNVTLRQFTRVMTRVTLRQLGKKLKLIDELPAKLAGASREDGQELGLHAGEWIEIRSFEEIARTLDASGKHKGLSVTDELVQHCGKRFRVRRRVDRIIDESTGHMLEFKKYACVALEGLVCSGNRATSYWFCRRELYPYWREAWLKRAPPPASAERKMLDEVADTASLTRRRNR